MNIKECLRKKSSLEYLSIFVLVLCVLMIFAYFIQFNKGFSQDPEDWGVFGSYFASIAGMLAFLGLIYTIKQSNDKADKAEIQFKISGERGIFFRMLELYQKHADTFNNGKIKGKDAFCYFNKALTDELILGIICKGIIDAENIREGKSVDDLLVIDSVIIAQDINYTSSNIEQFGLDVNWRIFLSDRYNFFRLKFPSNFHSNHSLYESYVNSFINKLNEYTISDSYGYMRYAAESLFYKNQNHLGQYFRNIYYLMEMISKSIEKDYYSKIFRAQLSSVELSLILYNSLCSNSSKKAVQYLLEFDMFNNLDIKDIYLGAFYVNIDDLFNFSSNNIYSKGTAYGCSYKTDYNIFFRSLLEEYLNDRINIK